MKHLIYILLSIWLASCANPLPPSGGPPDTTAPNIVYYNPQNGTLNFQNNEINIEFDKYMNNNKVIESIFMSPNAEMEFDWSGKDLDIEFTEPLDSNTTYALTLGTDYTDYHNNKPNQAFILVFSTGDIIDSGAINGMLIADNPAGTFIYAYRIDNINPDTLDIRHTKPHYRTQTGSNGKFVFRALKSGTYRIFAVNDQFKDGIYDEGTDGFGAAFRDVIVDENGIPEIELKIGEPIDKVPPMLYEAESAANNLILANFSEDIDSASLNSRCFAILDTNKNFVCSVSACYFKGDAASAVYLIPSEILDTNAALLLSAMANDSIKLRDFAGNSIDDTAYLAPLFPVATTDSTAVSLTKLPFRDSSGLSPYFYTEFIFTTAVQTEDFLQRITLLSSEDGSISELKLKIIADNIFKIYSADRLADNEMYNLKTDLSGLRAYNGTTFPDSVLLLSFMTQDLRALGAASGTVEGKELCSDNLTVVLTSKKSKRSYTARVESDMSWQIIELPADSYSIFVYCDSDGNEQYSYGNAFPFSFAEKFYIIEKEIEIKPRWQFTNIKLILE